jgi:hypothetical protein
MESLPFLHHFSPIPLEMTRALRQAAAALPTAQLPRCLPVCCPFAADSLRSPADRVWRVFL